MLAASFRVMTVTVSFTRGVYHLELPGWPAASSDEAWVPLVLGGQGAGHPGAPSTLALFLEAASGRNDLHGLEVNQRPVVGDDRGELVIELAGQVALGLDDEERVRQADCEALLVGLQVLLGELARFLCRLDPLERGRDLPARHRGPARR